MKSRGRKWYVLLIAVLLAVCAMLFACSKNKKPSGTLDYGDPDLTDADLEEVAQYRAHFKSDKFVGDVMPYYENGVYSFFYLAEGGNHPVYRADTTDFVHYEDKGEVFGTVDPVYSMIGTGSVVKANGTYYLFYTGHPAQADEKIMVATSETLNGFTKKENWMFGANLFEAGGSSVSLSSPLRSYDFRDPEAVYDSENERFILYISAKDGSDVPVVARYFVSADLSAVAYDGIAYRDTSVRDANMFECADVFAIGNKWYLTYSVQTAGEGADGGNADQAPVGQNGKMHYAVADSPTGTFTRFADSALDSHVYYAGKTVQDGESTFMAGWVRRRAFGNEGWQYDWGGHLSVHELVQYADGSLGTALPAEVRAYYSVERALDEEIADRTVPLLYENKDLYTVSREYSSYLLHATVTFDAAAEEFGFALGYDAELSETVEMALVPRFHKMRSGLRNRRETGSKRVRLTPGEAYDLVLFTEGSVVTLYVNNSVALTARVSDIGNRNIAVYASGGSVTFSDLHIYTPSEYADTLYTGGALTVTDADGARSGAVRTLHVAPDSPAVLTYTAENENYVRYTVATANGTAAQTVTVRYNGKTLVTKHAAAGEIIQLSGSTYAAKGKQIAVEIAADADGTAYANVSMETDKKEFTADAIAEVSGDAAQFTAGGEGVYEYVATLLYSGDGSGAPVFEAGAQAAAISANGNLLTLRGAVHLGAGEQLAAGVRYRAFTPNSGAVKVTMQVRKGTDTFATGVGTHALPVSRAANLTAEIVPAYPRVEIDYNRDANAYMEFGKEAKAQGVDGFVYAYGRAGDELLPMDTFNANEGFPLHSAPGVSAHLQARDGYLKAGDDYMSAFVWVAPVDAVIDVYARVKTGDGDAYVQAQLWVNGSLLADRLLHGTTDWVAVEAIEAEVKRGDSVALAVGACGKELPENPPAVDFTFEVRGDGVRYDPSAPVIADLAADFATEEQGDYGWHYMTADYKWDPERVDGVTALIKGNNAWGDASRGVSAQGVFTGANTAVVWKNYTAETLQISVSGSVEVTQATAIRIWTLGADGKGKEKVQDIFANTAGTHTLNNAAYVLAPGEMLAVIFGDVDNNTPVCKPNVRIAASAAFAVDHAAFTRALGAAKTIADAGNDEGTYTAESFAQLQTAITNGNAFAAAIAEKTYAEISEATAVLRQAVRDLRLNTAAAKAALQAEIGRAQSFTGKTLLIGDQDALAAAISAAQAVYDKQDATSEQITNATATLKTFTDALLIQVADFAADFTQTQGNNGWFYWRAAIDWENNFTGTSFAPLPYTDNAYTNGNHLIQKDGNAMKVVGGETAIAYRNNTNATHSYVIKGLAKYLSQEGNAAFTIGVRAANGTFTKMGDDWRGYTVGNNLTINETVTLQAGEAIVFILRSSESPLPDTDFPTDTELELYVGCNDQTATTPTVITQGANEWSVIFAGINFGDHPTTLKDIEEVPYVANGYRKEGSYVLGGGNGNVLIASSKGIAIVYTAQTAGDYTFTGNYIGKHKGTGRYYKGTASGYTEIDGWIGEGDADFEINKTVYLEAGEKIAFQFDGETKNALVTIAVSVT